MRCVLALDAGGTKCDVLYVREDGMVLGWGHQDAEQARGGKTLVGLGRDPQTTRAAMEQAMGDIVCDELHLTGFPPEFPLNFLVQKKIACVHLQLIFEYEPAFALLREPVGIVTVAGTGAVVFAQTRDGQQLRMDGLGPQLGDYGGGYQIGLRGLQAAAKAEWHPRHQTSLEQALLREVEMETHRPILGGAFIDYMLASRDRTDIARLARLVDLEARAGDAVAIGILQDAADSLAETVWDVTDRLQMRDDEYPLIGLGSIALKSDIYWQRLCARVRAFAPRFRFRRLEMPPVIGLALIALERLGAADPELLRRNLLTSVQPYLPIPAETITERGIPL